MALTDSVWLVPSSNLVLPNDEIHVWRACLDQPEWQLQRLTQTLSEDEQARSRRFCFEQDRKHYIAGRGILRAILSYYLDKRPRELRFYYSSCGKPSLTQIHNKRTLYFNLSHSHGLVLYAVMWNCEVGIDIEYIHPIPDMEQIARRIFSSEENAAFQAIPAGQETEAFFTCWVRKEAYIKARGDGLSLPLDQFDVSLAPGKKARLLNTRPDPQEANQWALWELLPGQSYVGAVAAWGRDRQLKCWEWSCTAVGILDRFKPATVEDWGG